MVRSTAIDGEGREPAWQAQSEIELLAGTPAGGGQDRPARALIDVLGRQFPNFPGIKLTNIPGRGGGNAWDHLRVRRCDPYVAAISSPTLISNRLLGVSNLDFSELTPLAVLYTEFPAFLVRSESPIRDGLDLAGRLAADASQVAISLATAIGNTNHIALAQVTRHVGGDVAALRISVFDSARYAIAELLAGRVELAVITAASAVPELTAGSLRCLAVAAPDRLESLFANVPTWRECGVDSVSGMWRGLIGAPGLLPSQVDFWERTLVKVVGCDQWKSILSQKYWADTFLTGAALLAFLQREREQMAKALAGLGLLNERGQSI